MCITSQIIPAILSSSYYKLLCFIWIVVRLIKVKVTKGKYIHSNYKPLLMIKLFQHTSLLFFFHLSKLTLRQRLTKRVSFLTTFCLIILLQMTFFSEKLTGLLKMNQVLCVLCLKVCLEYKTWKDIVHCPYYFVHLYSSHCKFIFLCLFLSQTCDQGDGRDHDSPKLRDLRGLVFVNHGKVVALARISGGMGMSSKSAV